jgi:hypothetical protein
MQLPQPLKLFMTRLGSYQVVIESSGVLLSIRGVRVTTNPVVLLAAYPIGYRQF